MVHFWLNDQPVTARAATDTTLLCHVRDNARLTGTKEGCASGDCGACTVLLGTLHDGEIHYLPINSCITPLGAVHGRHVVTVEHLKGDHPVQRALVDEHASQCGFCTPGVVMALTAATAGTYADGLTRPQALAALAGNLCRCTGYRPILKAAERLAAYSPAPPLYSAEVRAGLERVPPLADPAYARPLDLAELWAIATARPGARLVAGGTDLMLEVTQTLTQIPVLIELSCVAELNRVSIGDDELWMGAALSFERVGAELSAYIGAMADLIARIGSPQIRARGTLGGNLGSASPIGDLAPVLLALDASVDLVSAHGRRRLALHQFFSGYRQTCLTPGEIIEGVAIPRAACNDPLFIYKLSKRFEDDISSVLLAARFSRDAGAITAVRLGYGGVAATPVRAVAAERTLAGAAPGQMPPLALAKAALATELTPVSDVRASAEYRSAMAAALLEKAWRALAGEAVPNLAGGAVHA